MKCPRCHYNYSPSSDGKALCLSCEQEGLLKLYSDAKKAENEEF